MEMEALWRKVVNFKYYSMRVGWCFKEVEGSYGGGSVEIYKEQVRWFC
jgi:hypothetical protein